MATETTAATGTPVMLGTPVSTVTIRTRSVILLRCPQHAAALCLLCTTAIRMPGVLLEEFTVLCGRGLWDRPVKARVATARRSKPFLRLLYLVPSSLFLFFACFVLAILLSAGVCFFLLPFTIVFSWRFFLRLFPASLRPSLMSVFMSLFLFVVLFFLLYVFLHLFPFSLSSVFPSFVLSFCLAFLFPL